MDAELADAQDYWHRLGGMNHRVARWVFALAVGMLAAVFSYQWITNPAPRAERQVQEAAVMASRRALRAALIMPGLEIVDPLSPDRKVGKVYVYPADDGWEVSGYYRRNADDAWHPYLVTLDAAYTLLGVKVQDPAAIDTAAANELLEVLP